jgi:hypothetical protein
MHMPSAFPILFGIIHVPFDSFISQNEGNAELLCDNSLHDIQVFERGKDQIIYSCIYRYAAITLAEDMIPSPDQNGNYIDIDIGDDWWTNDVLIDYWELKIKDRALKKTSLSEEDDENSPVGRIAELGFENIDGSWEIRVSADDGTQFDFARLEIEDASNNTSKRKTGNSNMGKLHIQY